MKSTQKFNFEFFGYFPCTTIQGTYKAASISYRTSIDPYSKSSRPDVHCFFFLSKFQPTGNFPIIIPSPPCARIKGVRVSKDGAHYQEERGQSETIRRPGVRDPLSLRTSFSRFLRLGLHRPVVRTDQNEEISVCPHPERRPKVRVDREREG